MKHISTKVVEVILAFYSICVGLFFILDPTDLGAPVYVAFQSKGSLYWGWQLMIVGALHISAVILNGRSAYASTSIRGFACLAHFYICASFVAMFVAGGAIWGAITFGWLVTALVFIVSSRVFYQLFELEKA